MVDVLAQMGAIVMPPVPAFYARPASVEAIVDQTVGRVLDLFDIEAGITRRWGEDIATTPAERKGRTPI